MLAQHEPQTLEELRTCATCLIPTAGRLVLGLSRNESYRAAERGEIPVISVGKRQKVLVQPLLAQVGMA